MEQQKQPKRIKVSLKRRKPAGKPPVAPKDKPKANPKPRKAYPGKPREVSPLLTDMLQKLAGWTPHSNNGVLEVANRLAQAAMEEIDKDTVKKAKTDTETFVDGLLYHTLTHWNGVSNEYSLVMGVEHDRGNCRVKISMLRVFNYNRIGGPALLYFEPEYAIGDIIPPRKGQRNELCLQGRYYLIDGPQAMDTIKTEITRYRETLDWIFEAVYAGKLEKKCRKNRK